MLKSDYFRIEIALAICYRKYRERSSNQTILGLKLRNGKMNDAKVLGSNQTILGLKWQGHIQPLTP